MSQVVLMGHFCDLRLREGRSLWKRRCDVAPARDNPKTQKLTAVGTTRDTLS